MRIRNDRLIAVLAVALAGCSPSGVVVRQPPAPRPVPVVVVEPLEVDVARPHNGKLFVQTNRAAYVAIFEIVPERGVTLVYPVSSRQRRFVVAGLRDLPVWWEPSRVTYHGAGLSSSRSQPARYIYVLASDEPLRIPDAAFRDGYLDQTLGSRPYRATNPYATMRAIAREFVPPVRDEAWAEDAYALSPSYATERYRVTRVYCRDGSRYEVPAELADRVWCPAYPRQADGVGRVSDVDLPGSRRPLVRPDSVVGDNGRRVATRAHGSNGRGPLDRVTEPPGWENRENRGNGRDDNGDRPGSGRTRDRQDIASEDRPRRPNEAQGDTARGRRGAEIKDPAPAPPRATPKATRPTPMPVPVDKPTKVESPGDSTKSANAVKPEAGAETSADSKAEAKPEATEEKSGKPAKGRGRPNADEKSADRKPKQPTDPKP